MCAPDSKHAQSFSRALLAFLAVVVYVIHEQKQAAFDSLLNAYQPVPEFGWKTSPEALLEVQTLENYVESLAQHDLQHRSIVFTAAALGWTEVNRSWPSSGAGVGSVSDWGVLIDWTTLQRH